MADWDVELTEAIGKAIPNEISKLGGWLQYIPYIGGALKAIGSVDAGTTAYADTKLRNKKAGMKNSQATQRAFSNAINNSLGAVGGYANPGLYGSSGKPDYDWADYAGMTSTLWNARGSGQGLLGSGNNIYTMNTAPKDIDYGLQTPGYFDTFWNRNV